MRDSNYVVVQITPTAIEKIGWRFYIIFAILNASFLLPIYFFLPETAGLPLESVNALFVRQPRDEVEQQRMPAEDLQARQDTDESSLSNFARKSKPLCIKICTDVD